MCWCVIALGAGALGSRFVRPQGGVAVVDLDRVAKELGRDVQMANDLKSNQTALLNELATIQKDANEELKKMQSELGEDAPAEELQKLKQTADVAQQRFNQLQKTADVKLGQRRDFLVANFRQQARPIVYQVAKDHGAKAVVTETVLYAFDETIDITDAVIAKMRSTPIVAAPTSPTAPAAVTSGPVAEAKPAPAAAPSGDSQIRQASATTTKPAPQAKPAPPAKNK
jgi:Skp family chaperone for outer membrane proteins